MHSLVGLISEKKSVIHLDQYSLITANSRYQLNITKSLTIRTREISLFLCREQ